MRHRTIALSTCLLVLVTLAGAQAAVFAQTTDPSHSPMGSVHLTTRSLGSGVSSTVTGESIGLVRLTFWPGATLDQRFDPEMRILYVESGRLGYRLVSGTAWITHASTGIGAADGASVRERVTSGEIVLRAGDSLFAEAGVVSAAWNMSDAPTLVTIVTLIQPTQPIIPIR